MLRKAITVAAPPRKDSRQRCCLYVAQRKHGALKLCFSVSCNLAEGYSAMEYSAVWPFCHISLHPWGTSHSLNDTAHMQKDRYVVVIFKFLLTWSTYKDKSFWLLSFIKPSPPSRLSQSTNCVYCQQIPNENRLCASFTRKKLFWKESISN